MSPAQDPPTVPFFLSEKFRRTHNLRMQRMQQQKPIRQSVSSAKGVTEEISNPNSFPAAPAPKEAPEEVPVRMLETSFEPFALGKSSSFNPANVSPSQLKKMNPMVRAKYMAYEKPSAAVLQRIAESEQRAKKLLKDEHKRIHRLMEEKKKKWDLLHRAIEDPDKRELGLASAAMAKMRISRKKKSYRQMMNDELLYLVEGQLNSLNAIKLKEHLIKPPPIKNDCEITPQDQERIREILSSVE